MRHLGQMAYQYNPYTATLPPGLGQNEGDVSLVGPVILLLGLVGIGALIIIMKDRGGGDYYYDDYDEPAVTRLRNVIDDIESDDDHDGDDDEDLDLDFD